MEEENREKKESGEEILADLDKLLNEMPFNLSELNVSETRQVEFLKSENGAVKSLEHYDAEQVSADKGEVVLSEEQVTSKESEFIADKVGEQTADDKGRIEIDKQNIKERVADLSLKNQQDKLENLYGQTKSFSIPDIDTLFKIAEQAKPGDSGIVEISAQGGEMNLDENPKNGDTEEQFPFGDSPEESQEKSQEEISDEESKKVLHDSSQQTEEQFQPMPEGSPLCQGSGEQFDGQSAPTPTGFGGQAEIEVKSESCQPQISEAPEESGEIASTEQQVETVNELNLQQETGFAQEQTTQDIQSLSASAELEEEKMPIIEPSGVREEPTLENQVPSSTELGEEKTEVFEPRSIQFEQAQSAPTDMGVQFASTATGYSEQSTPTLTDVGRQEPNQNIGDKTILVSEEALTPSRTRQSVDLSSLVARQPPKEIPPDRIKSVGFLYSMEEEKMCAELLQEIDSICSKSKTKPMFVKRAFVKVFEPDLKGNYILEVVYQTNGMGLICVGNIPRENIYEFENVFNSSNVFFRHINQENFNHATVVDLIADLIIL